MSEQHKVNYLFLINSLGAGGAERSLLEFVSETQRRGIKTTVLILNAAEIGFEDQALRSGYAVQLVGGAGWFGRMIELRRVIVDQAPTVLYTTLYEADILGRVSAVGTDVPVVTGLVNTTYDAARIGDPSVRRWKLGLARLIDGWTARHLVSHFHAISEAVKDSAVKHLRVPPDRITVIPRGRDAIWLGEPSAERRDRVRLSEGIGEDVFVFITVGRQEYQKGHDVLIKAFAMVAAANPRAFLLIVGRDGHWSGITRRLIDQLGLGDRIRLMGHRPDVPDLLACADVFVFPSRYEGLGGAVLEAMALALPVITSDLHALNEVVTDKGSLKVPPGDAIALARAMCSMTDSTDRQQLGSHNRDMFLAHFRSELANERLLDLFGDVARTVRE